MGNGQNIYLWYDNWHPHSPLIRHYGREIVTQFGSSINAKLESIMQDGEWNWPIGKRKNQKVEDLGLV